MTESLTEFNTTAMNKYAIESKRTESIGDTARSALASLLTLEVLSIALCSAAMFAVITYFKPSLFCEPVDVNAGAGVPQAAVISHTRTLLAACVFFVACTTLHLNAGPLWQ